MQLSGSQKVWVVIILAAIVGFLFLGFLALGIVIIGFIAYGMLKGAKANLTSKEQNADRKKRREEAMEKAHKRAYDLGRRMARDGTMRRPGLRDTDFGQEGLCFGQCG